MIPRVNYPKNISTPDYIFRNMKFDLKEIKGNSIRTIENSIKNNAKQADNFILDISKSKLSGNDVLNQIVYIFNCRKR